MLCDDPRVTAFGLYLEGIKDAAGFTRAVDKARARGKPIAVVKSGRTAAASRTARSHTGALSGSDAAFDAYCAQAGIARCETLSTLCETLKIFHNGGPLAGRRVVVMGASGGDMAMTADLSRHQGLEFPPFAPEATTQMSAIVGERVTVANPFDMHTYLWFQHAALRQLFDAVFDGDVDAVGLTLLEPMRPVDAALLQRAGGDRIVILPTASAPDGGSVPQRWSEMGVAHFRGLGARAEGVLALSRADCLRPDLAEAVRQSNLVYFSGGKPDYLLETITGTPLWDAVQQVLAKGGVVAGCSAGAMIVGGWVPGRFEARRIGLWRPAFGYVPGAVIAPHFDEMPAWILEGFYRLRPRKSYLIGVDGGSRRWSAGMWSGWSWARASRGPPPRRNEHSKDW